jgi:hypothetical protein
VPGGHGRLRVHSEQRKLRARHVPGRLYVYRDWHMQVRALPPARCACESAQVTDTASRPAIKRRTGCSTPSGSAAWQLHLLSFKEDCQCVRYLLSNICMRAAAQTECARRRPIRARQFRSPLCGHTCAAASPAYPASLIRGWGPSGPHRRSFCHAGDAAPRTLL